MLLSCVNTRKIMKIFKVNEVSKIKCEQSLFVLDVTRDEQVKNLLPRIIVLQQFYLMVTIFYFLLVGFGRLKCVQYHSPR